jgi:hypothetical protein
MQFVMRRFVLGAAFAVAVLRAPSARADPPDPAIAVAVGAATIVAGFALGGTMMATSGDGASQDEAGWLLLESGFVLAPLAAHGVMGEWGRGAVFASVPAATTLTTVPLFLVNPAAVVHGTLPQQRVMWGLFCGGLAASMVGVIDAAFAPGRQVQVAPIVGHDLAGIVIGGAL